MFDTMRLPDEPDVTAPDGSAVRVLLGCAGGGLAHFELDAGATSVAVRHRTVEEIWFFVSGQGEMWRRHDDGRGGHATETVPVEGGTCITIPLGTTFQLRAAPGEPLRAIGVTMPPWPGDGEAVRAVGPWAPTVEPGPGLAEPD